MGKTEEIKESFSYMKKNKLTMFKYDTGFYILWLLIGMGIWICFLTIDTFTGDWFHPVERLFWWFWVIFSMFIWQRKNSNLVFKHNMQTIDAEFREMNDAQINAAVIRELIEYKKGKHKCCGSCKTKKPTKSSMKKKRS